MASKGQKKGSKQAKANVVVRFMTYLKDVRVEMRRVVWPQRPEILNSSLIVVATLVVFIAFVLVVDQLSSFVIIEQLAKLGR